MDRITLDLPTETIQRLDEAVANGEFESRSDAVEILVASMGPDLYSPDAVARLRELLLEGLASPRRPWNREEFLAGARRRVSQKS